MKSISVLREERAGPWAWGAEEDGAAGRGRRRTRVFAGVFLVVLLAGLIYTFARPAQYRAVARLQITPAAALAPAGVAGAALAPVPAVAPADPAQAVLGQIQVLTSRPLVERAWQRLQPTGTARADPAENSIDGLHGQLGAAAVEGTPVVELWAQGPDAGGAAALVNAVVEAYREIQGESYRSATADSLDKTREETDRLEREVAAKRAQVRDFQLRHDIVSMERDEQALLARTRSMSTALSTANERVVKAEAQLRSLQESAAAGRAVVRAKDNPTLAGMEQRVSQLREELRDLERVYAPDYLVMDPQVRAKQARLTELEEQIRVERGSSQAAALTEAQEELASARGAAQQLQRQMEADRRGVQEFSLRFNEYKAMQEELAQLEGLWRGAQERRVRLEASASARQPGVEVIEWAAVPQAAWSPSYGRDAAISLGAALILALGAVWLVDFLRPRPAAPTVLAAPAWMPVPVPVGGPSPATLESPRAGLLPGAPSPPRELAREEVAALLGAATGPARIAAAALLAGVAGAELAGLAWEDVDRERGVVRVGGASPRELPLAGALAAALEEAGLGQAASPAGPLLVDAGGRPRDEGEVDGLLLCAAHDAGLEDPAGITAAALRHTYLAYLVRQGVRFADLPAVVGSVPVAALAAYSALAPAGPRIGAERVEWVYPWRGA